MASPAPRPPVAPSPTPTDADLERVLATQIAVAHAGETSPDDPRLGWWDTDLASEFGGADLFRRLYPRSWRWAVVRALREAGRRADLALRKKAPEPDLVLSLFHFGSALDERLDERLAELEAAHPDDPTQALPTLAALTAAPWDRAAFSAWLGTPAASEPGSLGRRLRAPPDVADLVALTSALASALAPLPTTGYPMPHAVAASHR